METTKQTHKTIGENIDQEALVNSFFEGVAGPIDSGMREMVEEFYHMAYQCNPPAQTGVICGRNREIAQRSS